MSLIPAKYYYDDATQDQWQQKKKLKLESSRDKRAKLDPQNAESADSYNNGGASAKDVMDNRAKTAKKVVLPGSGKQAADGEKSGKEQDENVQQELIPEGSVMEFDDEGNDETETPQPKARINKKELAPEEIEAREKRRAELRSKLASKISLLREKRKAPGTKNGRPIKSREEMLAERKSKEEYKRQLLKRKREMEESDEEKSDDDDDEDDEDDDGDAEEDLNVLFGNIVFKDGSRVTSDLTKLRNGVDHKKKKGPSNNDIKGHLMKIEGKKRKLEQMTPDQRAKQQEKDQWLGLMAQAEGVKVKNDEKLLKKALKRKEKQKLKSEIEWKERKQVVKDTIAARLKRREANLKARRDNKGKKSKNQPRLKKFSGVVKKGKPKDGKKRAGFEGSAKSKKLKQ